MCYEKPWRLDSTTIKASAVGDNHGRTKSPAGGPADDGQPRRKEMGMERKALCLQAGTDDYLTE